jgi:hypothetical protein
MRIASAVLRAALLAAGLGLAGPAGALPLNWSGTYTAVMGDFPEEALEGGGVATIDSSDGVLANGLGTLRLAAERGNVTGEATIAVDPGAEGIAGIRLEVSLGTGSFADVNAAASSTMPLTRKTLPIHGLARLCLFSVDCSNFVPLPLQQGPNTGIGVGGQIFVSVGAIRISVEAAPWTLKTVTVTDHVFTVGGQNTSFVTVMRKGFIHDPASNSVAEDQPSGVVQLVTPAQITTNLAFGTNQKLGWISVLKVHFIPEPGALLSLLSGVVGLGLLARHRVRPRR